MSSASNFRNRSCAFNTMSCTVPTQGDEPCLCCFAPNDCGPAAIRRYCLRPSRFWPARSLSPLFARAGRSRRSGAADRAGSRRQPQPVHLQDYSKPRSAFPHLLQPYRAQELAQPNLGNSPRIDSLMRDGKIYLSIDDAVALALENNLDIDIARYNLNIADTDLLARQVGRQHSRRQHRHRAEHSRRRRGRPRRHGRLRHRRHHRRRRRRRHRHQRPGQFHARHRLAHHQLRSRSHRHAATRQERHRIRQRLQPRARRCAEHLHRQLRLHPGIPVGHALSPPDSTIPTSPPTIPPAC